ncbi:sensor histidine kinase [Nocardioides sp. Root151]|uniref:sensor histidine kinase n=1 Tax=Nocardioides sp. Root151 TaxID=1736475 RepID=UPI000702D975|nr:histidine kinase [Nocardioides sp. Root151]KQZ67464.1 histidine kinase [Nocardioides sp. Root151]
MPASPDLYQPPLTKWSSFWRYVGVLAISALAWSPYLAFQWREQRILFWVDLVVGLVSYLLLHLRRRYPLAIALITNALASVSGVAGGPATLATVSMATRRRLRELVPVGVVGLAAAQFYSVSQPSYDDDPYWLNLTVNTVFVAATLAWGMFIGSRRELLWTLRDRAERAEDERDLRVGKARGDERARIAREMHDVLAHRISQVSMQSGALAFRTDLTADEMRATASVVQEQANQALIDLRAVLGVLRDPGTGDLLDRPQPTYDDVAELIEDARESGMHIEYAAHVDDGDVPTAAGRTIYRIVQEGLTNARKHAPGTTVFVDLAGTPDEGIDVRIRNPIGFGTNASAPGAGLGLVGLTERAELGGGRLTFRKDGSMFLLQAWIPWSA